MRELIKKINEFLASREVSTLDDYEKLEVEELYHKIRDDQFNNLLKMDIIDKNKVQST